MAKLTEEEARKFEWESVVGLIVHGAQDLKVRVETRQRNEETYEGLYRRVDAMLVLLTELGRRLAEEADRAKRPEMYQ